MRPQYSVTEPPHAEPITLMQASDHLRVDSTDDQSYISGLISVAREYYDAVTGRASAPTSYLLTAPSWEALFFPQRRVTNAACAAQNSSSYTVPIYRNPLTSIESVEYYAPSSDELSVMDVDDYIAITNAEPGWLQLKSSPPAVADRLDAIQIRFTAGTSCPPAMSKHAIKLLVAHFYDQRMPVVFGGAASHEVPYTIKTLIETQKIGGNF